MLRAMIGRELRAILRSPKFAGSFAVGAALIVLSVFLGIQEYRAATRQYETATTLASQQLREETTWMRMGTRAFRRPEPMQIFVSGVGNDIGRLSPIAASTPVELRHSPYADDPIFAFFRMLDLVFLVGVVLSLFAILFTYDAISGERQDGTLKLALANRVPRARYLIAKGVGSWLALVVPLAIPVALSMLLLVVYRVPMDGERWMRLGLLLAASLLYFTFFLALGLLVSALTRRPSHSFLIALLLWVMLVLIIPRAGIAISSQIVPVPGVAEIEGRRAEFARDAWAEHYGRMEARLREERNAHGGPDREPPGEKETQTRAREQEAARRETLEKIDAYGERLEEDLAARRHEQERLGFALARFSPAAAYQLAVMNLADTDTGLRRRTEDAMRTFRSDFLAFVRKKQEQTGETGGMQIRIDSERGVRIGTAGSDQPIDMTGLPAYDPPARRPAEPLAASVADLTWIAVAALGAFSAAFARFLRYDVR